MIAPNHQQGRVQGSGKRIRIHLRIHEGPPGRQVQIQVHHERHLAESQALRRAGLERLLHPPRGSVGAGADRHGYLPQALPPQARRKDTQRRTSSVVHARPQSRLHRLRKRRLVIQVKRLDRVLYQSIIRATSKRAMQLRILELRAGPLATAVRELVARNQEQRQGHRLPQVQHGHGNLLHLRLLRRIICSRHARLLHGRSCIHVRIHAGHALGIGSKPTRKRCRFNQNNDDHRPRRGANPLGILFRIEFSTS
eukprot:scaffold334_cov241-Pinguiococcus_pyrenoidosus.AAC.44